MKLWALMAVFLPALSLGADIRGHSIGDSCSEISKAEAGLESKAVPDWPKGAFGESYAYDVREHDLNVRVAYLCKEGRLVAGNYYFAVGTLVQATQEYGDAQRWLIEIYGQSLWEDKGGEATRNRTDWHTPMAIVTLHIMSNFTSEPAGWRAAVMITPNEQSIGVLAGAGGTNAP
jgi:hypothetical protein